TPPRWPLARPRFKRPMKSVPRRESAVFDRLEMAPADPILGLAEAFAKDPRVEKINLSVGVYKDEHGRTPVLASVKRAEESILAVESTKSYKPIDGDAVYNR